MPLRWKLKKPSCHCQQRTRKATVRGSFWPDDAARSVLGQECDAIKIEIPSEKAEPTKRGILGKIRQKFIILSGRFQL